MRTLAIDYAFDPNVYDVAYQNQYMFGQAFLVAPFESTKDYGKVYLPGGLWYNLYTDEQLQGKQAVIQPLSVSSLPVYVKEGSIIPMQSLVQTTAEAPTDTLSLHIYNGSVANELIYYEDDGKSYSYENDGYYKRALKFNPADHSVIFDEVSGNFKSKFHAVKLIMHGFNAISQVKIDGKAITATSASYKMTPDLINNSYSPGTDSGTAKVYEISFSINNRKQTINY